MLHDHCHPPLSRQRHWTGFHSAWATHIAGDLNRQLPDEWFAEPNVHWGIEVDVGAYEEVGAPLVAVGGSESMEWQPPEPVKTIAFPQRTDVVEVQVHRENGDVPLVGVIELVSPANKDRPETRDAFVSQCDNYLRDTIGLIILDAVTERRANLHSQLMNRAREDDDRDDPIYASAYRPLRRNGDQTLSIWYQALQLGGSIPAMPLFLKDGPMVRVNFEETYRQTCEVLRIP
jgi:Protein of unknown function (DUF4058)